MTESGRRVRLGRIVGISGVHGEVKLESWTEPRERIFDYQPWQLVSAPGEEAEIGGVRGRKQGKGLVAHLPGIDDRDAAAALIGTDILIERAQLPPPAPGEYYWADLEEMAVVTLDGHPLGRVSHLLATGANDVLVVRGGVKEYLVPLVMEYYVRDVDLEARRIVVDWDPAD
jgi:16S rRNA processing protein RimM